MLSTQTMIRREDPDKFNKAFVLLMQQFTSWFYHPKEHITNSKCTYLILKASEFWKWNHLCYWRYKREMEKKLKQRLIHEWLTDGISTILLAETERPVILQPSCCEPEILALYDPRYSRRAAWNRLRASSWILASPYLRGQDLEGNFLSESVSFTCMVISA